MEARGCILELCERKVCRLRKKMEMEARSCILELCKVVWGKNGSKIVHFRALLWMGGKIIVRNA